MKIRTLLSGFLLCAACSTAIAETGVDINKLKVEAETGNKASIYNLGLCYLYGKCGIEPDYLEAQKWFSVIANDGDPTVINNLALAYSKAGDHKNAVAMFFKAAENGSLYAINNLGINYLYGGDGLAINYNEAIKWFSIILEKGEDFILYPSAINNLGIAYDNLADYKKSFIMFKRAAELGDSDAMINLAISYNNGKGTLVSQKRGFEWALKAAKTGNKQAQLNVGVAYKNGVGVKQNFSEAAAWYAKASDHSVKAQCYLANMYAEGKGVKRNLHKAKQLAQEGYDASVADSEICKEVWETHGLGDI